MVIPSKRSITLVYKSMKLNFISYTKHLTAGTAKFAIIKSPYTGTNDINSNNNCYTAKSETQFTG